eukprot:TRINITY_DN94263_c0_g1_i1.p1 TRINITY_DN94263_c0_g1~~TRINITY_DN94263_c0_g1_i1.p1  ORF type:complete len:233 (-),score=44.49 TRINITY_DN94263_c0_g1_i1:166-864(-)
MMQFVMMCLPLALAYTSQENTCVGDACVASEEESDVSGLLQVHGAESGPKCEELRCAQVSDACKYKQKCCDRDVWCRMTGQPLCEGRYCHEPKKLERICNQVAVDHHEAFKTYDNAKMAKTFCTDAYMQYGTGSPISGKDNLVAYFGSFFNSTFNSNTCANTSAATIITSCPKGQPCNSYQQWSAECESFRWATNMLTMIFRIKNDKCCISLETGVNSNDCSGSNCTNCSPP